jgi:OOP family OmpA-OmpF porin
MSVIAHTARIGDEKRNRSLSVARARNVANYLSSQAIDARFVAAQGLGSQKPLVNNAASTAVAQNSRVEITFRNVIV